MVEEIISKLNEIEKLAEKEIEEVDNIDILEEKKILFLGRKGKLKEIAEKLPMLSQEEKRIVGERFNFLKEKIERLIKEKEEVLLSQHKTIFDFDIPISYQQFGEEHLLLKELRKMIEIFQSLGFSLALGPEIVLEKFNFDLLNIPPDHPAREMQDTIWLQKEGYLFRTHTSAEQVPYLLKNKPPVKVIIPGKVFRFEATDRTHDFEFHQIEGLSVGEDANLKNLFWNLEKFFQSYFEEKIKIRARISYFPFVEPGLEVDISCPVCSFKGCELCKFTGFVEVAGAGMIHPNVLKNAKINPQKYRGYAFGLGVERMVMLKYQIGDIRILHGNIINYLGKFKNEV
jgi:phenylalanyl-tRNA synthetase alpha chain